jgi:2',3'-cyclic-nucleotide 2'-phosphodiesterase/3'-nucleotidase
VLALSLALVHPVHAEDLTVRILHTTDLHGTLAGWDDVNDRPAPRGLERLATLIGEARADGTPTLLVDAGDALSGSSLVRAWREGSRITPEPVVAALNTLGYDALAVGNHEFDGGRAALDSARSTARFPFLAANVLDARTGQPAFGTSIVKVVGGVRIGIVGLTTPVVPMLMDSSLCRGLTFVDPLETARREVARLRGAERCNAVIVLFHSGLERDPAARGGDVRPRLGEIPNENLGYRLAYEVPGIDMLVLGHTHVVVPSTTIGSTIVTQAGRNGEALGRIELRFSRATPLAPWTLMNRTAAVRAVTDSVAADPAMHAQVAPYLAAARTMLDEVVAQASAPIAAPYGRFGDNALLRIIQRCQLEASGADVSLAAMFDPTQVIPAGPCAVVTCCACTRTTTRSASWSCPAPSSSRCSSTRPRCSATTRGTAARRSCVPTSRAISSTPPRDSTTRSMSRVPRVHAS